MHERVGGFQVSDEALHIEQRPLGALSSQPLPQAAKLLRVLGKLDRPTLDFVAMAKGMGVPGRAVTTADEFNKALEEAVREPGPRLIEVQF